MIASLWYYKDKRITSWVGEVIVVIKKTPQWGKSYTKWRGETYNDVIKNEETIWYDIKKNNRGE